MSTDSTPTLEIIGGNLESQITRNLPRTLGDLVESGWRSQPVAKELATNAARRIMSGQPLFDNVSGFDDTVLPQMESALLAGHDIILLGERGQAKTRLIRSLVSLLDEWMPIVSGSEVNDDPYCPVSRFAINEISEFGDKTRIDWIHRDSRYGEKLATPDTSMADLIGEIDPIKIAEGKYLSDELALHFGLIPRVNRGIFAINELPDLSARIQVGLLNLLEERDIQIRGHRIRLRLDIALVATANPEDYTNRGRIVTPLKDRFGAQIRTHYPLNTFEEATIVKAETQANIWSIGGAGGVEGVEGAEGAAGSVEGPVWPFVTVPDYLLEIVAEISQLARKNPHINQRSGVSVRLSIANYETLVASALRRALRGNEATAVPRVSDLIALLPSTQGKVEFSTFEHYEEVEIIHQLIEAATLRVFERRSATGELEGVVSGFSDGLEVQVGSDMASSEYLEIFDHLPPLRKLVEELIEGVDEGGGVGGGVDEGGGGGEFGPDVAQIASAIEFILEGLFLSKKLSKDSLGPHVVYRSGM